MNSKLSNLKRWIKDHEWRVLLVAGAVVFFGMPLVNEVLIEHWINKKRQEIMAVIQSEEQAIRESKEKADRQSDKIDAEFNKTSSVAREVIASGHQMMDSIDQQFK